MSDGSAGAKCAEHFDEASAATCTRCGRFCCESCLPEREPPLCPACAPALMDPFGMHGRSFELVPAFTTGFRLLWAELPRLLLLVVVFAVPSALLQVAFVPEGDDLKAVSSSIRVENFYDAVVGLIGAQAMLALLIARSEGRVLTLGGALAEGVGNWGRALGARLRSGLWILGFALLLLVPAFWKATLLMFATVAALRRQDDDALHASEVLVRGRFWPCLGFGLLASGVAYGPMFVVLMVGAAVGELVPTPRLAVELFNDVFTRFCSDALMTSFLYVAFVMLHRTAGQALPPMRWRRALPLAAAAR